MRADRARHLGHLHQRQDALLHPRPARQGIAQHRQALAQGALKQAGDLFPHRGAHGPHHEPRLHDKEPATHALHPAQASDHGLPLAAGFARLLQLVPIIREAQRVARHQGLIQFLKAALVQHHGDAGAGAHLMILAAAGADVQVGGQFVHGQAALAAGAADLGHRCLVALPSKCLQRQVGAAEQILGYHHRLPSLWLR